VTAAIASVLLATVVLTGAGFGHTGKSGGNGAESSAPQATQTTLTTRHRAEGAIEPTPQPQPVRTQVRRNAGDRASRGAPRPVLPGCFGQVDEEHPNGQLPAHDLCRLPGGAALRGDAARAFALLTARARRAIGTEICVGGGYRSYAAQARLYAAKPGLAAPPGYSNHGAGTALDLCGAAASEGSGSHVWLDRLGPRFGWIHPAWARPNGSRPEPWHFEYMPNLHLARR